MSLTCDFDKSTNALILVFLSDALSSFSCLVPHVVAYKIFTRLSIKQLESLAISLSGGFPRKFFLVVFDWNCEFYFFGDRNSIFGKDFEWIAEKSLLSGITNNLVHTVETIIFDSFNYKLLPQDTILTSELYLGTGILPDLRIFYNELIQQVKIFYSFDDFQNSVFYDFDDDVNIPSDDVELSCFSSKNMLGLRVDQLKIIKNYFNKINRNPTKIELEMLAQSWSEHCKHNIFSASIDEIEQGLYKHYIKRATEEISQEKDFCVSVFSDNAGAVSFDEDYAVAAKVETHNSPSALEPYGGAMTGLLGVNRDLIGFGLGALPISNHYGYCFSDVSKKFYREGIKPVMPNVSIVSGVIKGVKVAGNHSGIPTTNGFVHYGAGFVAKPLVFVGSVGIIPKSKCFKQVKNGDLIVIIGGRTGKDGIHGATFSSIDLELASSNVVQIGDPITQKKFSDAIIKEARDLNLYNAITDNGAGGLSSSVGEMGKEGFVVDLSAVPLKHPKMLPWEIWLSESQERMTLSVPRSNYKALEDIIIKHGSEIYIIGEFNFSGKGIVKYNGKIILELDANFINDANPKMILNSQQITILYDDYHSEQKIDEDEDVLNVLKHKNIISRRNIAHLYDYEVQGNTVLKPLQGYGKVFADATIIKPLCDSSKGIVQSQSIGIFYEEVVEGNQKDFVPFFDPYLVAKRTVEVLLRNMVTAGANINKIALLDNFCWSNFNNDFPYNKKRLWQLKEAARSCYEVSKFFKVPFISGKDSMFNNATLYDEDNVVTLESNFPVLLMTGIGVIDDIEQSISLDAKFTGDAIYILGDFTSMHNNNCVLEKIMELYIAYNIAVMEKIIASGISINFGGLLTALSKKLIGGNLSASVDLGCFADAKYKSFSGILVTIDPKNELKLKNIFKKSDVLKLGNIVESNFHYLEIKNHKKYTLSDLRDSYYHE